MTAAIARLSRLFCSVVVLSTLGTSTNLFSTVEKDPQPKQPPGHIWRVHLTRPYSINGDTIETTFVAPYDGCVGDADYIPTKNENDLFSGFSIADHTCQADTGEISTRIFQFGGVDGEVGEKPNYEATVNSGIKIDYLPVYTGDIQVDVFIRVNANVVVTAGPTGVIPNIEDAMVAQIGQSATDVIVKALLDIGDVVQSVMSISAGVIGPDVYLRADNDSGPREIVQEVMGKDYAATFLPPPHSQDEAIRDKQVTLSLKLPVEAGQKITIDTGLRTHGFVHGWAFAAWNAKLDQVSYVDSIKVTELNVPSGNPGIPTFEGTIYDENDKRFSKTSGQWSASPTGYDHHHWLIPNNTDVVSGKWLLNPASSGNWEVYVYIPNTATTSHAAYAIYHNGKTDTTAVDQSSNHNSWVSLGTFDFAGEGDEYLLLKNDTGEQAGTKLLAYDAAGIRWIGENQLAVPSCIGSLFSIFLFVLVNQFAKRGRLT